MCFPRLSALLCAALLPALPLHAQAVTVPIGTPLWITSDRALPLRVGQAVTGKLVYDTFADGRKVLPAGTVVRGAVVSTHPDRSRRIQSRLRADFTPFSRPEVKFTSLNLPGGEMFDLNADPAQDGATVIRLTPPKSQSGGFIRRQIDAGVDSLRSGVAVFTAPGKKDRLQQLLYSQLPYHPQTIPSGTVWTVNLTAPMELPVSAKVIEQKTPPPAADTATPLATKPMLVDAYLPAALSSATAKVGEPITALVAQPVHDSSGAVAVPQGAVLHGEITRARPARRFGRTGELRFDFRQISFPGEDAPKPIQSSVQGIDAAGNANLSLDREGEVKPKPKDKLVVPFILLTLAARPLDRDRGDSAFRKDAVASNSLGVIGFVVGTAGGWRNVAAGIGYYGSAVSIWNRWIKRGDETVLRQNTRIVLQTSVRNTAPLQPDRAR